MSVGRVLNISFFKECTFKLKSYDKEESVFKEQHMLGHEEGDSLSNRWDRVTVSIS